MSFWILTVIYVLVLPPLAFAVKPRLEVPLKPGQLPILLLGVLLSLVLAIFSINIFIQHKPISEEDVIRSRGRVKSYEEIHDRFDMTITESGLTYQVISGMLPRFDSEKFAAEHTMTRFYDFTADKDLYLLATDPNFREQIGILDRPDLVTLLLPGKNEIVWIYGMESEGSVYLDLEDANAARSRQIKWLIVMGGGVFSFAYFALLLILIAHFQGKIGNR